MDLVKYLTIKFKHRTCGYDFCDCLGFIRLFLLEEYGVTLPEPPEYGSKWVLEGKNYIEDMCASWGFEQVERPIKGDVIFLATKGSRTDHLGVILGDYEFIHCGKFGVIVSNYRWDRHWASKITGYYRYKGR